MTDNVIRIGPKEKHETSKDEEDSLRGECNCLWSRYLSLTARITHSSKERTDQAFDKLCDRQCDLV